jgi:hypothetical protein
VKKSKQNKKYILNNFTAMKTSFYRTSALVISFTALGLLGCEKNENLEPNLTTNQTTTFDVTKSHTPSPFINESESLQNVGSDKVLAAPCENYSLILSGITGTPHAAGLSSYLANVNMVTGLTTAVSPITVGGAIVRTVTGITKIPAVVPTLYAVTGQNSATPRRLLRVNPATGASAIVGPTVMAGVQIALQDIEHCPTNNRYYAIQEGTNRIMVSINALNWTVLATVPTNYRLNGLTFRTTTTGTTLWVIAGQGATLCGVRLGDMYNYTLAGGLIGTNSYNAATPGPTTPELGLDFYANTACAVRNFVVGSASGTLSFNLNLCSGAGIPAPIGGGGVKSTYDFAKR